MRALVLLALLPLAACEEPVRADAPADPAMNLCGAYELQGLVGQNRSVLATMSLPSPARVIGPDMAVTMDFSPERLNITYDRANIITGVTCG